MLTELQIAPFGMRQGQVNLPNPTQQKVLEWVDAQRVNKTTDSIPVLYIQGGVGSGKSRAILAVVDELLTQVSRLRVLWGRWDFKDIKLSIMDKFFEIMPPELIINKSEQYHWYDIMQDGGKHSRIYFNGLKDISGLGSQEFGIIVVTEVHEITEQVYRALKRRCRQEGVPNMILLEGEAPNEDHWLSRLTDPNNEDCDSDIEKWELSTYENWDNLPLAYRGSLEKMPEAWKRKYLFGKCGFIPDGTPYYTGFKEFLHSTQLEYVPGKPLIIGLDFGFHHPAAIISQIDQYDRWCWLREIMGTDITIHNFADKLLKDINFYYPGAECVYYGDPACHQVNDKSEQTSYQICQSKGIQVYTRQSTYRQRKEIIELKLSTIINGKPSILIDNRFCRTAVDGFLGGYHYPMHKPGQQVNDKFEIPYRDGFYEHIINAGEYIAVNLFSPVTNKHFPKRTVKRAGVDNI